MEFDWDEANEAHLRQAGFEPYEAEEALSDPGVLSADAYNLGGEQRWGALGETEGGQLLFVVFTHRNGRLRVITARRMNAIEKRRYRG